jgi:Fic family protein
MKNYRSGEFINQYGYRFFKPNPINRKWILDQREIILLLEEANLKLGELNAFSLFVPNIEVFTKMHIVKEATQSSRIEGTQTQINEALLKEEDIDPKKKEDWKEVQNYIETLNYSLSNLNKIPICARFLKEAHKVLFSGIKAENKFPGEFRKTQNWIGGATLKDATFVPPAPSFILDCIKDLEEFLNNDHSGLPHLIKIGIAHYQFEAIHPFVGGWKWKDRKTSYYFLSYR